MARFIPSQDQIKEFVRSKEAASSPSRARVDVEIAPADLQVSPSPVAPERVADVPAPAMVPSPVATSGERRATQNTTISRTSAGLREALFDQLERLRSGQSNPQEAIAFSKVAAQIIASVRIEIDLAIKLKPSDPGSAEMIRPLELVKE